MIKKIKKIISVTLCAAILPAAGFMPAAEAAADSNTIIDVRDWDMPTDTGGFTGKLAIKDVGGDHGRVAQLNTLTGAPDTTTEVWQECKSNQFADTGLKDQVLSADFYLESTDMTVAFLAWSPTDSLAGGHQCGIWFNKAGEIAIRPSGSIGSSTKPTDSGSIYCGAYTAGEWHNITVYYDYKTETDGDKANDSDSSHQIYFFFDGKEIHNMELTNNKNAGINKLGFVVREGANSQIVYVDNVSLRYANDTSFMASAEHCYDEKNLEDRVEINFNEPIKKGLSLSDIVVTNNSTGDAIKCDVVSQNRMQIVIGPQKDLRSGQEYTVVLPESLIAYRGGAAFEVNASNPIFTAVESPHTNIYADVIGVCDTESADVTSIGSTLAGKRVYADTSIKNPLETEEKVLVALAAYNNFEMKAMESNEYTIGAGSELVLSDESEKSVSVVVDSVSNLTLKLLVLRQTENGYDLVEKSILSNAGEEIVEAANTFVYEGTAKTSYNDIMFDITQQGTIVHRDALQSDDKGRYKISFTMPLEYHSGDNYEHGNAAVTYPVVYTNKDEKKAAIDAINNGTEAVEDVIKEHTFFFMDSELSKTADYEDIAKFISEYIQDNTLTEENAYIIGSKAAIISAVKAGAVDNAFDYSNELDMANSSIGDFYNKDYVGEAVQGYVTDRLKNSDAVTFEAFDDALAEAFVLSVVQKPDGIDNLIEVLNAFSEEIGITKNEKDSVYSAVSGNSYDSFTELVAAFKNAKRGGKTDGYKGGGSSSYHGGSSYSGGSSVLEAVIPPAVTPEAEPLIINIFEDIEDSYWGRDAIVTLAELDVLNGKGDGCFYPEDNVTREEFVKIVVNALKLEIINSDLSFSDVDTNEWYYPYISTAVKNGIITGYEDGRFGIGENITRQDMCVILHRAAKMAGYVLIPTGDTSFSDLQSVSDYALESVNILSAEGIINGYETGDFRPLNSSSRAECATMIYNFLNLFNKF